MLAEVMRHLMWRRRVRAANAWRDAERVAYQRAVDRLIAVEPTGMGTIGRPRS